MLQKTRVHGFSATKEKKGMRQIILDFPKQLGIGFETAKNIKIKGEFDGLIVCGMGGSALPGEILKMWLESGKICLPLILHKNYGLPYNIDKTRPFCPQKRQGKNYLVICISYSGDTEETISAYQEAQKKNLPIIVITSNSDGRLAKLCKKNKTPIIIIPSKIPSPLVRLAIGYQFAALVRILVNCNIIQKGADIKRENVEINFFSLKKKLNPEDLENQGKKLAEKLFQFQKIPFIYASEKLKTLAYIWKISFNETSKIIAEYGIFPELSHNEINGFWKINDKQLPSKKLFVIFLKDLNDNPRILKQMKIIQKLIEKEGIKTETISLIHGRRWREPHIFEKIFSNIILAFWTSYYLALEYRVDPIKRKLIDELKERLKKK